VTNHLSKEQVEDYRLRRIAPNDLLNADDHLSECADCRRSVYAALNTAAVSVYADLASESTDAEHLSFQLSAAYVDGALTGDERRMVEDHVASCARCAPLVADLRAFRNEIAPELGHEYRPASSVPDTTAADKLNQRRPGRTPWFKVPGWIYALAPALLLLAVAAWIAWRSATLDRPKEITVVSPTPAPTQAPTPESAMVQFTDGGSRVTLDASGNLSGVEEWSPEDQRLAREALISQRLERSPQLAGLSRSHSSLMGSDREGQSFAVIDPAGKIVLNDRPTLRWSRLMGASGYIVEIYDERFTPVITSPIVTNVTWTSPPLQRGQVFSWQVKAIKDGQESLAPRPPAPQAKFRIVDQAKAAEKSRVKREHPASHLLLGLVYARAGLLDEAERELRALQKANPNVEVVRRLAASIR
jgi:hypothetical protein